MGEEGFGIHHVLLGAGEGEVGFGGEGAGIPLGEEAVGEFGFAPEEDGGCGVGGLGGRR